MRKQIRLKEYEQENADPIDRLKFEIVLQACRDFEGIMLGYREESMRCNLAEIERFFKGGFCDALLCGLDLDAAQIWADLNKKYPERITRIKRKRRIKNER